MSTVSPPTENLANVPILAGFEADKWQLAPLPYRVLLGELRVIDGLDVYDVNVQVTAVQLSDSRIDDGTVIEPPHVHFCHNVLTTMQARDLAAVLIEAIDELDRLADR